MSRRATSLLLRIFLAGLFVPTAQALTLDLTAGGAWGSMDGAIFKQFSSRGAGSGHVGAFLRIQSEGIEHGYNTDARPAEYDQKTSAAFSRSLLLSDVPIVVENGIYYREFLLDINQKAGSLLSLDALMIALHPVGDLYGYCEVFDNPIYDLDRRGENWIILGNNAGSGSGSIDMIALIPDSLFTQAGTYVYLYSRFGEHCAANAGYEEWACRIDSAPTPEPVTALLLALGATMAAARRQRCGKRDFSPKKQGWSGNIAGSGG